MSGEASQTAVLAKFGMTVLSRTADLYAECSEGRLSALHVEMCIVQQF
jgi:hypothetical protein